MTTNKSNQTGAKAITILFSKFSLFFFFLQKSVMKRQQLMTFLSQVANPPLESTSHSPCFHSISLQRFGSLIIDVDSTHLSVIFSMMIMMTMMMTMRRRRMVHTAASSLYHCLYLYVCSARFHVAASGSCGYKHRGVGVKWHLSQTHHYLKRLSETVCSLLPQ